ncbi:hypothetical protein PA598K_01436 [Paenibacillus sp. 598K]|uniref:hypothetical protein n=1 Tax=Paenibacillus sp. 598K TaxID=1117987 RepID=UPI000FF9BF2D|nr:hypothetical protein [Paenibacillus sp. 598K]GBF73151.1 hypothetical protein PA598K_01436 [Paenibacillus sp. 598K]
MSKYDKESIYDEQIAPLMKQIIEICKREELPMVSQFYLKQQHPDADVENDPMYSTTMIIPARDKMYEDHHAHLKYVAEAMMYGPGGRPYVMAITVQGGAHE